MLFNPGKPGQFPEVTVIHQVAGMIPMIQIRDFLTISLVFQDLLGANGNN